MFLSVIYSYIPYEVILFCKYFTFFTFRLILKNNNLKKLCFWTKEVWGHLKGQSHEIFDGCK